MSLEQVEEFAELMPFRLGEDVLRYAGSVQAEVVDIFREAKVKQDRTLGDQLIFLAGVKKLHPTFRAFRKVGFHHAIPLGIFSVRNP